MTAEKTFVIGTAVRLTCMSTPLGSTALTDPTALKLEIRNLSKSNLAAFEANWPTGTPLITKLAAGSFQFDHLPLVKGRYEARWTASGAIARADIVRFTIE